MRHFWRWLLIVTLGLMPLVSLPQPAARASGVVAEGPKLYLRAQTFDPRAGEPLVPAGYRAELAAGTPGLRLIQFAGPIRQGWVETLERNGARIVTYLPDYAYLVWSDGITLQRLTSTLPVRWTGVYHPYYALHPALRSLDAADEADVLVQLYAGPLAAATQEAIVKRALAVTRAPQHLLTYVNLGVRLSAKDLPWLVTLPGVVNVEPRPRYHKLDEVQTQIMAGALNSSGTAPTGPGYLAWLLSLGFPTDPAAYPIVDITDDGIDNGTATPLHADFYVLGDKANPDRLVYNANWTSDASADGLAGHGNINASIVGGYNDKTGAAYQDANGYHYGLGVNPLGRLAGSKVFNNSGYWDLPNDDYVALVSQGYAQGMRISSNSWGANTGGAYTTDDQAYDALTRDAQPSVAGNQEAIMVFAAGNAGSGSNTVGSPGVAKNVITVGAAENVRPAWTDGCNIGPSGADNAMDIISFSSRGPTDDQRVKPDLVAPGTHITGAASQATGYDGSGVCDQYYPTGQTLYAASSGTSHSTPAVAGAASLVYRYYQDHFGGQPPSPAMVKAYLVNSVRYLTGVSANDTLPSNAQGFGETNLGMAFDGTPRIVVDQNVRFDDSGEVYTLLGQVANTTKPFRITLAWTDAPGPTVGAAYVNNLDLEVEVNGTLYRGNVFTGGVSTSGGSADARNNVESVFLPAGVSGPFVVRVRATNIAGDGVPNVGDSTDQDFALVIYNGTQANMGTLTGTVRDAQSAQPLSETLVRASLSPTQTLSALTDAQGHYRLSAFAGTYTVTASLYGYLPVTVTGVSVSEGVTTTLDFNLTPAPAVVVSGTVRDAQTGWPLYAALTISAPGAPQLAVWTDPVTGFYSTTLVVGQTYTFDVAAFVAGYQRVTRTVAISSAHTEDFALTADTTTCSASGYTRVGGLFESFDGVTAPALPVGWATEATSGSYVWLTNVGTRYPSGQAAHSSPNLIYYPSYSASSGSGARLYTTQALTLSNGDALSFWMYHDTGFSSSADRIQVQVSVGGGAWQNVGSAVYRYDGTTGWKQHSVDLSAYAGQAVRVALLATSGYGNDLHVDDVQIGSPACVAVAGGLLVGNVTDANTAAALNGVALTAAGRTVTSVATPADPAVPDGFYTLFLPTGTQTVTATLSGYVPTSFSVAPLVGGTRRQDVALAAGWPQASPAALAATLPLGTQRSVTLTLTNPGGAPYAFTLQAVDPIYQPANVGGPDPYGYTYRDSREAGGPRFEWLDITDGTPLNLSDDGEANITLPFAVSFYGQSATALRVGNNGAVLFNATSGDVLPANVPLASATTNNLIAPFWDDLDATTGNVYWKVLGTAPHRRVVITWHNRPHYSNTGAATLQLILYEGRGSVKFQYLDVDFGNSSFDRGAGATVGIRRDNSAYLQYSYNVASLENELAICFLAPGEADCDPQADWLSFTPVNGTVAAGGTQAVQVTFNALAASVEQPGVYRATLRVLTDTPYEPLMLPVTMTVNPPVDWGALEGTVTADRPSGPLADAAVTVFAGATTVRTLTTDAQGHYLTSLPEGAYEVRFAKSGYLTQTLSVTVTAGLTTTQDALLRLDAPALSLSPTALTATLQRDTILTQTLWLTNTGTRPLTYRVLESAEATAQRAPHAAPLILQETGAVTVDPKLLQQMANGGRADVWVRLRYRPDLSAVRGTKAERGAQVIAALHETAERTQGNVVALLEQRGLKVERFWVVNALLVHEASLEDVRALQALPEVIELRGRFAATLQQAGGTLPNSVALLMAAQPDATVAWGVTFTKATDVWTQYNIRGEGIVVANIDTGVQWDHPALKPQYRGWNGSTVDHNYAWYAPTITATTACSGAALAPCDWNNHGTHTMGTMVGDTRGGDTGVVTGMAPRATWMACMGCDTPPNQCSDEALTVCAQWFLAPTDLNGNHPDPTKAPDIINNSWGDTGGNPWYEAYVNAWVAAGIFPAFSAGNSGSGCSTTGSPGDYALAFASAAVDSSGTVGSFSSRGPGLMPGVSMKPDIAAPGVSVYSTIRGSSYGTMSGTSMASPHTAGAVALVWAANSALRGQVANTFALLRQTARASSSEGNCGKPAGTVGPVPNYTYGYGYLDALAAVEAALSQMDVPWLSVAAPEGTLAPGQSVALTVRYDATGLVPATYTAALRVLHNDPLLSEVRVPVTMTVLDVPPVLALVKRASAPTVEAGTRLTYTLTVTNSGGVATNLVVRDPLPAGTNFAWADQGGALVNGEVVWPAATLPSQNALQVRFAVTVSCVPSGTLIVNPGFSALADGMPLPATSEAVTTPVTLTPPQAAFSFAAPVLRNRPVTFVNQSVGARSYRWDFGDGATATTWQATHPYTATGAYTVTLTAYHICPDVNDVAQQGVQVEDYAVALTPLRPRVAVWAGESVSVTFVLTNVGTLSATVQVLYAPPAWGASLPPQEITLAAGASTPLTVTLNVPSGVSAGAYPLGVVARVLDDPRTPKAQATAETWIDVSVCTPPSDLTLTFAPNPPRIGQTVTFTATASGPEPITYLWYFGDGEGALGAVVTHVFGFPPPGTDGFTLTLDAISPCGARVATMRTLTFNLRRLYVPLVLREMP